MKILFYIFSVCLFIQPAFSQNADFVFTQLNDNDGLSNNSVNCIMKDSRGIMWIGTNNGLNRFDGANFYAYKSKRDTNSMPDSYVYSICEDKKGNIWGATNNGIFCFNPVENKFANYYPLESKYSNVFLNILCDKKGNVWAGSWVYLVRFNAAKNQFEKIINISDADSARQYSMRKNSLLIDPSENGFWMGTRTGMFYYDLPTKKLLSYKNQPGNTLFNNHNVNSLAVSRAGHCWYYDNATHAVTAFNPSNKKILFEINIEKYIPNASGTIINEDSKERLWFSTWNKEVLMIDYKNNFITRVDTKNDDPASIARGTVWAVYEDEDASLWFGTQTGISMYNPVNNFYKIYHMPLLNDQFKNTGINHVKEDPADNSLWITTDDLILTHWDKKNNSFTKYDLKKSKPGARGSMPKEVVELFVYKEKIIVSTFQGIWYIAPGMKNFEPFTILPDTYKNYWPAFLTIAGDSVFYFSDYKKIVRCNIQNGSINEMNVESDILPDGQPFNSGTMKLDSKNHLWANNTGGWAAREKDGKMIPVLISTDKSGGSVGYFTDMQTDSKGNTWFMNAATGLYAYNIYDNKIQHWDDNDGMASRNSGKLMPDQNGNVWIIQGSTISVLLPGNRFNVFNVSLNEKYSDYETATAYLKNGNMLFSIYNDLVEVNVSRINAKPAKKIPFISMVNISGKDLLITNEKEIILAPDENVLRFRFGILIDKKIFPYDMEYRLEGADDKWIKSEGKIEAVYNKLAPGTYTFRVRAKGKNNNWESEEKQLRIIIKTPFYKTTWFLALVIALVAGLIVFMYRYRLAQQKKVLILEGKAQELEKEKALVMYESLKQQLNPHFLFNSLSSLSGLIESDQQLAGTFLKQMSKIYRYILKSRDSETVKLKEEIDFVETYINLQKTRFEEGLQVNINIDEESKRKKIPPVTLQNMVENAIKHNIIDNDSPLVIDMFVEGDYLVIKNNLQKKIVVETSNKQGLKNLESLYRYLSDKPLIAEEDEKEFRIKIPLI